MAQLETVQSLKLTGELSKNIVEILDKLLTMHIGEQLNHPLSISV
jgi:hypothetical protein